MCGQATRPVLWGADSPRRGRPACAVRGRRREFRGVLAAGSWELKDKRMPRPGQSVTPSQSCHSTPETKCCPPSCASRSEAPNSTRGSNVESVTADHTLLRGPCRAGSRQHWPWRVEPEHQPPRGVSFPLPGERSPGALPACLPPALLPAVLLARRLGVRPPLVPSCLAWGHGHTHTHRSEGPGGTRLAPCFVSIRG